MWPLRFAIVAVAVAGLYSESIEDSDCQEGHCAVSHLQLHTAVSSEPRSLESFFSTPPSTSELQQCLQPVSEEDMFKPITEILYEHPGEDTWCIIGKAGNRSLACALARKHRDMRAYVEYNHQRAELAGQVAALAQPRKVELPDGSTLKVRDYDDLFCMINGYYNMSREEALNDYEALTHMSEHFCSISKELVPDYNSLSLNYLVEESPAHARYIKSLLMSDRPVEHLNQSDIDVFRTEAAIQCRMDNDHGGNCDVAWCNYRGCLDADGVTVRQTDYGECPPV